MKKNLFYLIIAIICTSMLLGCSMGLKKTKEEGISFLKDKNYANALNKFNEVLNKDSKDSEVLNLKTLTENCIALTDKFNKNEFTSVIEDYDKIKTNTNFDIVSKDINEIYNLAKKKPNLKLKYVVYGSEEFENNNYFEDGKGEILLSSRKKDEIFGNAFIIDTTRPASEVLFQIENTGIDPAEALVLNFKFNNMAVEFKPSNPKWSGVSALHGLGLWNEVKFAPKDEPLYKDIPIKFTFIFANAMINDNASIDVTLLAKDCTTKKITIPVKVKQF